MCKFIAIFSHYYFMNKYILQYSLGEMAGVFITNLGMDATTKVSESATPRDDNHYQCRFYLALFKSHRDDVFLL